MEGQRNNPNFLTAPEGTFTLRNEISPSLNTSPNTKDGHVFVPPKPVDNVQKQQKYNLKINDFDLLVTKVGEKDFVQILKNIFNFLTSNNDEEEFRDISKDMEEILVRIVKDVDVLKSDNIYGKSYCEKIIEILNDAYDSQIFKLVCFFKKEAPEQLLQGLGMEGKIVLVYKKLYQIVYPATHPHGGFPSMSSMSCSPPISRSASTDSLSSQRSSLYITPPSKDQFIPHCFQLIINFVRNAAQQSLEFSGLSAEDAKFLHSSFSSIIAGDARGKNICVDLWKTVKVFSSRFEFKIMYIKAQSLDTKSLLMEKQCLMNASSSTDNFSDYSGGLIMPMTAKQKKVSLKYGKFVENLNFGFITRSLENIVYFLSDDAQGTLVGSYSGEHEKKFLKNIVNLGRSDNIQALFDAQHRRLFSEMCKLLDGPNFKMRTTVNKRKGRPNEILYIKMPRFESSLQHRGRPHVRPSYNKPVRLEDPNHQLGRPCERPSYNKPVRLEDPNHQLGRPWYPRIETTPRQPMSRFVRKGVLHTNAWQHAGYLTATNYGASTSQSAMVPTSTSTTKDIAKAKVSNINFQAGGLMTQMTGERDPILVEVMQRHEMPDNFLEDLKPKGSRPISQQQTKQCRARSIESRPHKKGKGQLIDALSVPVRSDKALKMMMGMGWTGGALGTRGDGITEPIMPHLRTGTGAGLGHAKGTQIAPKPTKEPANTTSRVPPQGEAHSRRTPPKFREIFLGSLIELLNSSDKTKTVDFNPRLEKKERTFIRYAMQSFATRTKIKLSDEEQPLVDKVAEHYANDLALTVTVCIADDFRQIAFEKKYTALSNSQKEKLNNLELHKDTMKALHQIMDCFGPVCQKAHALQSTQFRVKILLEILSFIKNKKEKEINMVVDKKLTSRQKNYLDLCLSGINKRARFGVTTPEVALSMEIKKYIGAYGLGITFSKDLKSFTITKDYSKSITSQATNLDSADDIDYLTSDNDDDDTKNEESDDVTVGLKKISSTDDPTENNDQEMEVQIEKGHEINKNGDLKSQTVNKLGVNIDKAIKEENIDEEIKTEENIPESEISMGDDTIGNSCDDISMSENSGFTENLDYNEADENDINMIDDGINSDKQINKTLDLSNIYASTSNVENDSKIKDVARIMVYLSKECDACKDMPKYVQGLISYNIMEIKEKKDLPLLKCHGLHDNFLIYSCHTKKTYDWLHNICVANKITICTKEFDKMSLKIKTFFDFDVKYIFDLLEMYNEEISTKEWSVLKKESLGDFVIIDVKMDKKSVKSILESNLELYAGVDKVTFNLIWD